ncbi:hypothetical protein EV182_004930, partial [Spiromyces aspiralis]
MSSPASSAAPALSELDSSIDKIWSPDSWRSKPIEQDVVYDDQQELRGVIDRIQKLPPLVAPEE